MFSFVKAVDAALGIFRSRRPQFGIKSGYRHRGRYTYFDDRNNTDGWQREVYEASRDLMRKSGLRSVADIGCGSAFKLINILGEFDTVGVDVSPTFEWLQSTYPDRRWVRSFSEEANTLEADVVVCADVIEHVEDPDQLLNYIKGIRPKFVVISTPARELVYRGEHNGPPANKTHVREWSSSEFQQFIGQHFHVEEHRISNHEQCTQMMICTLSRAALT